MGGAAGGEHFIRRGIHAMWCGVLASLLMGGMGVQRRCSMLQPCAMGKAVRNPCAQVSLTLATLPGVALRSFHIAPSMLPDSGEDLDEKRFVSVYIITARHAQFGIALSMGCTVSACCEPYIWSEFPYAACANPSHTTLTHRPIASYATRCLTLRLLQMLRHGTGTA